MRHLTIVERLMAAVLLPFGAVVALPMLASYAGVGDAVGFQIATAAGIAGLAALAVRALARSIARPIAEVAATIDAIAYAEMAQAPLALSSAGRDPASSHGRPLTQGRRPPAP